MRVRMGRAWRARVERHGYFLRQTATVSSEGGITVIDMSRARSEQLCLLTWKERVLFTWRGVTKTEVFRLSTPKRVNNRRHLYLRCPINNIFFRSPVNIPSCRLPAHQNSAGSY